MVMSYYGQTMYRQQQLAPPNGHFQANGPWYAGYHQTPASHSTYCVQEEQQMQQMWQHHTAHTHGVFQHEFQDFLHAGGIPALPPHNQIDGEGLHSPTITVSGSDMSSPGAQSGNITPPQQTVPRPPQARSPYEWIKKNSYQTQPNPDYGQNPGFAAIRKTRTKDKYRVVYTDHQRIELEKEFTFHNKYITIRRKTELAANLGLSERQIKIWFQNRRAKERKQNKKRVEEKGQIDLDSSYLQQNTLASQHHQSIPHLDLQQQQNVLQNLVPPPAVMQRFTVNNHHPLKIETSDPNEQLG